MIRRSLGVTLLGGFLTFFGGFSLLIMLLDIISWIDLYGAGSVAIVSLWGLKGFISYFLLPVLLYSAGIGVLLQRKWARRFLLFVFPFLTFFFVITANNFIPWLIIVGYCIYFLSRADVARQFFT